MVGEKHILCLLHNSENVTKMELFGELQASLKGFEQGSGWTDGELVVSKLPSAFWKEKGLGLSRNDCAENTFRTYFEVGPSFM